MSEYLDKCFSAAKINGLALRNRVIKAATFEGMSRDGVPSDGLIEFHRRIAEGGGGDDDAWLLFGGGRWPSQRADAVYG